MFFSSTCTRQEKNCFAKTTSTKDARGTWILRKFNTTQFYKHVHKLVLNGIIINRFRSFRISLMYTTNYL